MNKYTHIRTMLLERADTMGCQPCQFEAWDGNCEESCLKTHGIYCHICCEPIKDKWGNEFCSVTAENDDLKEAGMIEVSKKDVCKRCSTTHYMSELKELVK